MEPRRHDLARTTRRRLTGARLDVPIYALGDREPAIDPTAYVHPDAVEPESMIRLGMLSYVERSAHYRAQLRRLDQRR